MNIDQLKGLIPNSNSWLKSEEITFGWSGEQKYIIWTQENNKFLLRILTNDQFEKQLQGIEFLEHCGEIVSNVPRVLSKGKTTKREFSYLLLDYIEGDDGMQEIERLNVSDQYELGYKMGNTICQIHNISTPKILPTNNQAYIQKVKMYLDFYTQNKSQFSFLSSVEDNVNNLLAIISTRPMIMLHNDFHLGNMVIGENTISLIDFNRACLGDNIREFDCIAWTATHSIQFAVGLFDAYLQGKEIDSFFRIWRGYLSIWQIQMLYFIQDQDEEEKRIVLDLIKFSESWFEGNSNIPNWYLKNSKLLNKQ